MKNYYLSTEMRKQDLILKYYSDLILDLIKTFQKDYKFKNKIISEKTLLLISYGDNLKNKNEVPLKTLKNFFEKNLKNFFEILHILPFYPSSSDGGFSVTDHKNVNKDLGTWNDISLLSNHVNNGRLNFEPFFNKK